MTGYWAEEDLLGVNLKWTSSGARWTMPVIPATPDAGAGGLQV